jgi:hypothetical protein
MPEFDLKQIEKISEMCGVEMVKQSNGVVALLLPDITGLTFTRIGAAKVIAYFNCSEWDKDPYKRKFILSCAYSVLQRCYDGSYQTGRAARHPHVYDIRAEQDPVKFCKMMLRKTINKAKLLRKNEIKKAGAEYDV